LAATTPELEAIKQALLEGLRIPLTPAQGVEAFARHQLLAIRFHRAARLNQRSSDREGQGWCRFFREHFPRGDAHAPLLWGEWRVPLLKDETPGAGIVITHGQGWFHWQMTDVGLCIDLEPMWNDFEQSVEAFVTSLSADSQRRRAPVERWRDCRWEVKQVTAAAPGLYVSTAASVSSTATAIAPSRS